MTAREKFESVKEDFDTDFKDIPESDRLHPLKDVCAMMYLHRKFGGDYRAVECAEHDIIYLAGDVEELTEEDALYLARCGVFIDSESDHLAMLV